MYCILQCMYNIHNSTFEVFNYKEKIIDSFYFLIKFFKSFFKLQISNSILFLYVFIQSINISEIYNKYFIFHLYFIC